MTYIIEGYVGKVCVETIVGSPSRGSVVIWLEGGQPSFLYHRERCLPSLPLRQAPIVRLSLTQRYLPRPPRRPSGKNNPSMRLGADNGITRPSRTRLTSCKMGFAPSEASTLTRMRAILHRIGLFPQGIASSKSCP